MPDWVLPIFPAAISLSSTNHVSDSACFTRIMDFSLPERVLEKSPNGVFVYRLKMHVQDMQMNCSPINY